MASGELVARAGLEIFLERNGSTFVRSLRLEPERRLVDHTTSIWNQIHAWLDTIARLRQSGVQ